MFFFLQNPKQKKTKKTFKDAVRNYRITILKLDKTKNWKSLNITGCRKLTC